LLAQEREDFEQYEQGTPCAFTNDPILESMFAKHEVLHNFQYSVGGQISFDVFPFGWNKTYCLQFLQADGYDDIHFFGDKTELGGNDYENLIPLRLSMVHSVKGPADTMRQLALLMEGIDKSHT